MVCRNCGAEIDEDSKVCNICGAKINGAESKMDGEDKSSRKVIRMYPKVFAGIFALIMAAILICVLVFSLQKRKKDFISQEPEAGESKVAVTEQISQDKDTAVDSKEETIVQNEADLTKSSDPITEVSNKNVGSMDAGSIEEFAFNNLSPYEHEYVGLSLEDRKKLSEHYLYLLEQQAGVLYDLSICDFDIHNSSNMDKKYFYGWFLYQYNQFCNDTGIIPFEWDEPKMLEEPDPRSYLPMGCLTLDAHQTSDVVGHIFNTSLDWNFEFDKKNYDSDFFLYYEDGLYYFSMDGIGIYTDEKATPVLYSMDENVGDIYLLCVNGQWFYVQASLCCKGLNEVYWTFTRASRKFYKPMEDFILENFGDLDGNSDNGNGYSDVVDAASGAEPVIQENGSASGQFTGTIEKRHNEADPMIGGYDYDYWYLKFDYPVNVNVATFDEDWNDIIAEYENIEGISVISDTVDFESLEGRRITVEGLVSDSLVRGSFLINVSAIK